MLGLQSDYKWLLKKTISFLLLCSRVFAQLCGVCLGSCGGRMGYMAKRNLVVFQETNEINAAYTFIYTFI